MLGAGVLGCCGAGVLGCWDAGVLGCGGAGVLGCKGLLLLPVARLGKKQRFSRIFGPPQTVPKTFQNQKNTMKTAKYILYTSYFFTHFHIFLCIFYTFIPKVKKRCLPYVSDVLIYMGH